MFSVECQLGEFRLGDDSRRDRGGKIMETPEGTRQAGS